MKKTSKPRPRRPARAAKKAPPTTAAAKRASVRRTSDGMRAEYDFSGGVRGKYAKRFAEGTNIVVLEPDVAAAFKSARAVNAALRKVIVAASETQD